MPGGTDFFRGMKFFLRLTLCWKKKSQLKSGPQKSPNLTVCRVSHTNFDTGIQFATKNHIYKWSWKGFFRLPSQKMPGGTDFFRGRFFFKKLTLCWKNLKWKVVLQKAQIWPCAGFLTPISTPESNSPRKLTSIEGLGTVFFGFLHKMCLAGRIFSEGRNFFTIDPMLEKISIEKWSPKKPKFDHVPRLSPQFRHRNPILHEKSHL